MLASNRSSIIQGCVVLNKYLFMLIEYKDSGKDPDSSFQEIPDPDTHPVPDDCIAWAKKVKGAPDIFYQAIQANWQDFYVAATIKYLPTTGSTKACSI
jgi:hypothetical protein